VVPYSISSQTPDPPHFSIPTTFKVVISSAADYPSYKGGYAPEPPAYGPSYAPEPPSYRTAYAPEPPAYPALSHRGPYPAQVEVL
jgi:hypothetical protein